MTDRRAFGNEDGIGSGRLAVAVVVASIDARTTACLSLRRFVEEVRGRGEVVLVDASRDGTAEEVGRAVPEVRVIRREAGALAPELWRDGLLATGAPLVAFSTAAMVPGPGWLDAMLSRLEATGAAAVGGPIEPAEALGATDRAVYLLRYLNYLRPIQETAEFEPPGDNAIYRRDRLHELGPVFSRGFWEVEIHRRLRARGERLTMAPDAVVTFQGGSRLVAAFRQRHRHARHYGAARSTGMGVPERLLRVAAAPLIPAVLLRRMATGLQVRGRALGPWLSALPELSFLLAAWSVGEARGTWSGTLGMTSNSLGRKAGCQT